MLFFCRTGLRFPQEKIMREQGTGRLVEWLAQSAVLWDDAAEQMELLAPAMPEENDKRYMLARAAWYRQHAAECRDAMHGVSALPRTAA